jgi:SAM-dependent methyltransferase
MEIYRNPAYYELAFSFFDVKKQVDTFEQIIREFSKIKVKRFLDVACGPSLQLREIAKRGHEAVGLDSSPQMLRYLSGKAREEGLRIETVQADMSSFRLGKKVDFAFIMMGSLVFESNKKFLDHLDSVACSLKKGALYFIQNKAVDWTRVAEQSWIMEKDGVTVKNDLFVHFLEGRAQPSLHGERSTRNKRSRPDEEASRRRKFEVHLSTRVQSTREASGQIRVSRLVGRKRKHMVPGQTPRKGQDSEQHKHGSTQEKAMRTCLQLGARVLVD